jgi:hypothetical protein
LKRRKEAEAYCVEGELMPGGKGRRGTQTRERGNVEKRRKGKEER